MLNCSQEPQPHASLPPFFLQRGRTLQYVCGVPASQAKWGRRGLVVEQHSFLTKPVSIEALGLNSQPTHVKRRVRYVFTIFLPNLTTKALP